MWNSCWASCLPRQAQVCHTQMQFNHWPWIPDHKWGPVHSLVMVRVGGRESPTQRHIESPPSFLCQAYQLWLRLQTVHVAEHKKKTLWIYSFKVAVIVEWSMAYESAGMRNNGQGCIVWYTYWNILQQWHHIRDYKATCYRTGHVYNTSIKKDNEHKSVTCKHTLTHCTSKCL